MVFDLLACILLRRQSFVNAEFVLEMRAEAGFWLLREHSFVLEDSFLAHTRCHGHFLFFWLFSIILILLLRIELMILLIVPLHWSTCAANIISQTGVYSWLSIRMPTWYSPWHWGLLIPLRGADRPWRPRLSILRLLNWRYLGPFHSQLTCASF